MVSADSATCQHSRPISFISGGWGCADEAPWKDLACAYVKPRWQDGYT